MSIRISIGRSFTSARALGTLSSATLASLMLAACGGGGGSSGGTTTPPPPAATNVAPVANPGTDPAPTLPTDTVTLTGTATDDGLPTGSTLSYTWEFVSGPTGPSNSPGATITSATAASTSVKFTGGAGDYLFNFKASDGSLTGTSQLHVNVKANPDLFPAAIAAGVSGWTTSTPAAENMDATKLNTARDYSMTAGITGNEAGYVIRHGKLVYEWGDPTTKYEMKSTTKSMGGLALLLALDENKLTLADKVSTKISVFGTDPVIDTSAVTTGGLADITVLQLATHTSGLSKSDQTALKLLYTPGTTWSYSDQGLNWLADVLTQTYAQDLNSLMFSRVFTTLGIGTGDLNWRPNQYRTPTLTVSGTAVARRELGSGINANVNAMARVGLLMLRQGVWGNQALLSKAIVAKAHTPPPEVVTATLADPVNYPLATTNYGMLWWTNATGQIAGVPTDAYWAWGLHETFIIVVPSLDLVIARAGDHAWNANGEAWNADYQVLAPFLTPIVQSVTP
jgi:CubicO group peptidase (beta-lactamase class C family)